MKIKIATEIGIRIEEFEEIRISGQKDMRLFIRQDCPSGNYKWNITEYLCGSMCAYGSSKKKCLNMMRERIKKYGVGFIIKLGEETVKKQCLPYPINC